VEEELVNWLLAHAALAELVADRIKWSVLPQGLARPAVVLSRVSGARDYTTQGRSGLVDSLVQVDCWGGTYGEAKLAARAVVTALDGLTREPFRGAFVEAERDSFEQGDGPQGSGAADFFRTSLDVRVWHTES
jgi:hypothetical protein